MWSLPTAGITKHKRVYHYQSGFDVSFFNECVGLISPFEHSQLLMALVRDCPSLHSPARRRGERHGQRFLAGCIPETCSLKFQLLLRQLAFRYKD